MARPDDSIFMVLARKVGYPSEAQLLELRGFQVEALRRGERVWLYDLACSRGVLDAERQRRFERWTDLVIKGDQGPIRESGVFPTVPNLFENAAAVAQAAEKCPWCGKPMAPGQSACSECVIEPPSVPATHPQASEPPAAPADKKSKRLGASSGRHDARVTSSARQRALRGSSSSSRLPGLPAERGRGGQSNALLVAGGVGVVILLVVGAVAVTSSNTEVPPSPSDAPAPRPPAPLAVAPPPRPAPSTQSDAVEALRRAEKFEAEGREANALAALETALEQGSPKTRDQATELRDRLNGRVRGLLEAGMREIEDLILAGNGDKAQEAITRLRIRLPTALVAELDEFVRKTKDKADAQARAERRARAKEEEEQARVNEFRAPERPRDPEPSGSGESKRDWKRDLEARKRDISRYAKCAVAVLKAIAAFSPSRAKSALDDAGKLDEPELDALLDSQREIVPAFARFADSAKAGLSGEAGKDVVLEMRDGQRIKVKIVRLGAEDIVLRTRDGDQTFPLGDLAPSVLHAAGLKGVHDERWALGAGAWLAFTGQKRAALEALAKAPQDSKGAAYLRRLLDEIDDDDSSGPTIPGVETAPETGSGSQVFDPKAVKVKDEKPLTAGERKAALEAVRKAGGWAVAVSSKYYDFFSNGTVEEVKDLAARMDIMFEGYKRVFGLKSDPKRPFPIWLYKNHREFAQKTGVPQGVAGFYDGDKIVAFHGTYYSLTTEKVLFHEGAHQFEGLAFGDNLWRASIWFVEGLAVYFEASQVDGRSLVTDVVPKERLAHVKRALKSGDFIPLSELISTDARNFTALHYAHAWSLIYFLCYGTNGGLERLKKYYEGLKAGKEGVKLFEEIFNKPMKEIEDAWKDYVLALN